ncbi:MAG: WecB/TagA/CpsF family glycosyltransferase [Acutalibacteraceae bacterium]|nr:WecB/TagA/CpsF family glycosyltransferase [Acutalibacteraceae bacterium]
MHNEKTFVVTANPETFVRALSDEKLNELLLHEEVTVVADGIGIVKGAKKFGLNINERIPGIDIANELLKICDTYNKSIYFFGSKQDVVNALCDVVKTEFPNINIVGAENGYSDNKDIIFDEIKQLRPDVVFVALGIPNQEKLIYKHYFDFDKGIFVGVGGSFDVISKKKARAPKFFIDNNIEWLYRIFKEPFRIKRFIKNNVQYMYRIIKRK